jgi:hypothetical protein
MTRLEISEAVEAIADDVPFTMPFFLAGMLEKECRRQGLKDMEYSGDDYSVIVTIKLDHKMNSLNSPEDEIPLPSEPVLSEEETIKQLRADMVRQHTERIKFLEALLEDAKPAIEHYKEWQTNSSLEKWFPFSAAELAEANKHFAGCWYCEKCGFQLQKSVLYVQSGSIGADNSPFNEMCPNDGQLMKPMTLKKAYDDILKTCETQIKRAVEAEEQREEARHAHKIQQANYIELYEAVMGEGCHTAEAHDIVVIAKRHREFCERNNHNSLRDGAAFNKDGL